MAASPEQMRHRRPLAGLAPSDRRAIYAGSGMHSPNGKIRTDADAFEIRSDVTVEDACMTALRVTRSVIAQLELMEMTDELPMAYRDAIEGVTILCRLVGGSVGLVHAALCDEPRSDQPSLDMLDERPPKPR